MVKKLEPTMHKSNQYEHERIHLLLIDEACKGIDDVIAGRVKDARMILKIRKLQRLIKNQKINKDFHKNS